MIRDINLAQIWRFYLKNIDFHINWGTQAFHFYSYYKGLIFTLQHVWIFTSNRSMDNSTYRYYKQIISMFCSRYLCGYSSKCSPLAEPDNLTDLHRAGADSILCSVCTQVQVPLWNTVTVLKDRWLWQESAGETLLHQSWGLQRDVIIYSPCIPNVVILSNMLHESRGGNKCYFFFH